MIYKLYLSVPQMNGDPIQRMIVEIEADPLELEMMLEKTERISCTKMFERHDELHRATDIILKTEDIRIIEVWDEENERRAKEMRRTRA